MSPRIYAHWMCLLCHRTLVQKKPSLNSTLHWRQLQVPNNPLTTGCSWPDQRGIHSYIPSFLLAPDTPIRRLFYRAQFSLHSFYLQSTRCSGDHRIMQWPKNFCPRLFRVSESFGWLWFLLFHQFVIPLELLGKLSGSTVTVIDLSTLGVSPCTQANTTSK